MTPPMQANSPSRSSIARRPVRAGWVGPVIFTTLVVVWVFSLWTYDTQMTNAWREDRDERLDLTCQMLAGDIGRSVRKDLGIPPEMLRAWRRDDDVPNEIVREARLRADAMRGHFSEFRILTRERTGDLWEVVAGDRRGPPSPVDTDLATQALRGEITVGAIRQVEAQRAQALVCYGARDLAGRQFLLETIWELTPETLNPTRWSDLEQVVWWIIERSGEGVLVPPSIDPTGQGSAAPISVPPWVEWHLTLEPLPSWFVAENRVRRAIWIFGGLGLVLTVAFLLRIEHKNKILVALTNRSIENAALLETVLDGSEDYSIIATDLTGQIIQANRGTERLYQHPSADLIGKPLEILSHPQSAPDDQLDAILRSTLETGRHDDVAVVRRADGSHVHAQLTAAVLSDAQGDPIGFVVISHDVSALLDRTMRLEELNTELTEQTRMARRATRLVNEFLANVSHELRTPLNAILGYAKLVERKTREQIDARQSENLRRIHGAGESLLSLINDLLDLSKIEAGRMPTQCELIHLQSIVEEVAQTVQPLADKQRDEIRVEVHPEFPTMVSDPHHLRQIVMNLVGNAIKFTSKGTITIALNPGRLPQTVQLSITDTGIGIPEEQLPRVFDAFFQVADTGAPPTGGTGLGLSIVQRLAQQLGGSVTVDSHVGKGTVFTVTLPRDVTDESAEPPAAPEPKLAQSPESP